MASRVAKSRKSVVRLVKNNDRKTEKLPEINSDTVAVKQLMKDAEHQKKRVQGLI